MAIVLNAEARTDKGKGASRRLRRANKLPAIVYGAGKDPENLTLLQKDVQHELQHEAFYTQILELNVDGKKQDVLLRDLQHHAYRLDILHIDFQRVEAKKEVHVNVPLHFLNEDVAPGVKQEGGAVSHLITEVEVVCLPKDIPEFIDVDLSEMHMGEIVHLSDLNMPAGVEVFALKQGEEHDTAVANIHARKGEAEPGAEEEAGGAEEGGETED
ncbi:MAG: 50S ribosomal protein L25/general stress protein Ctc [Gammaproteobacteria bacterium]|nr:50S ribosomal protein L25/general stress protein Ctc [Gammaproteobacteria bacterium]